MPNQPDETPKHDPNKIYTNAHDAYKNWLIKRKFLEELKRREWTGNARKRAKEIDKELIKKLKEQENGTKEKK